MNLGVDLVALGLENSEVRNLPILRGSAAKERGFCFSADCFL